MENQTETSASELAFDLISKICDLDSQILLAAFSQTEEYKSIIISKRNGKKRNLFAPKKELLLVQRRLLKRFFYRIAQKYIYIRDEEEENHLYVNPILTGFIPGKSHVLNSIVHTKVHTNFILHLDLKDAFPSVNVNLLKRILENLFYEEIDQYQIAYKERIRFFEEIKVGKIIISKLGFPPTGPTDGMKLFDWKMKAGDIIEELLPNGTRLSPWDIVQNRTFEWWRYYSKFPLFPANKFSKFRKMIRDGDRVMSIRSELISKILFLITYKGVVTQGSATSGLIFNLVVSQSGLLQKLKETIFNSNSKKSVTISMYADDIVVGFIKRPSNELHRSIIKAVESSGFRINHDKTKLYDRRSIAPAITGFKLIRKTATNDKLDKLVKTHACGAKKRQETLGKWVENKISLPKKNTKKN